MKDEQRLILSHTLSDLVSNNKIKDVTINKFINLIISESIALERYDLIKRLCDNSLI